MIIGFDKTATKQKLDRIYFFNKMYGVDTFEEIVNNFKSEYSDLKNNKNALDKVMELYRKYHFSIMYLYTGASIKKNMTAYRNAINEEGGIWKKLALESFYVPELYTILPDKTTELTEHGKKWNITYVNSLLREIKSESTPKQKKDIEEIELILQGESFKSQIIESEEVNEETETATSKNLKKIIKATKKILDADETEFKSLTRMKKNQNIEQVRAYYIVILNGLTGGRRLSEQLAKSEVIEIEGEFYHNGILKKKGDENLVKLNLLDLSIEDYKKYQKQLRKFASKKVKEKTGKTLKQVTLKELNLIFDKVFNNAVSRISPRLSDLYIPNVHELRHLYTIEHEERYVKANPQLRKLEQGQFERALKSFRYEILGHEERRDTTKTYTTTKSK